MLVKSVFIFDRARVVFVLFFLCSFSQDLISKLLTVNPDARITASEACNHAWLHTSGPDLSTHNLRSGLGKLKLFNAKRKLRAAVLTHVRIGRFAPTSLFHEGC